MLRPLQCTRRHLRHFQADFTVDLPAVVADNRTTKVYESPTLEFGGMTDLAAFAVVEVFEDSVPGDGLTLQGRLVIGDEGGVVTFLPVLPVQYQGYNGPGTYRMQCQATGQALGLHARWELIIEDEQRVARIVRMRVKGCMISRCQRR